MVCLSVVMKIVKNQQDTVILMKKQELMKKTL